MRIKRNLLFCLALLLNINLYSSEVPNVLVEDNTDTPVPILKLAKQRDREAELNIGVRKISTTEIEGKFNVNTKGLIFELPEKLLENEDIYLTDNIRDLKTKKISRIKGYSYEYRRKDNEIVIENGDKISNLYILKYNKSTRELIKTYKWNEEKNEYISLNKSMSILFSDDYIPYEEVILSNKRILSKARVTNGEALKLPLDTEFVEVYDIQGNRLEKIKITNGYGEYGLGDNIEGVTLRNYKGYLTSGVGFENGELILKLKNWSSSVNEYTLKLKIISKNNEENYGLKITPPKQVLKIESNNLNFDFGKVGPQTRNIVSIVNEVKVSAPQSTTSISVEFTNKYSEDISKLSLIRENGTESIDVKLTMGEITEDEQGILSGTKLYTIPISAKIEEDISNKPEGTYSGKTEIIVSIDS